MKQVLLVTSKNFLYREELVKGGYSVTEYNLPITQEKISEIGQIPSCSFSIAEATAESIDKNSELYPILRKKGNVICCADVMTDEMKRFLLDCGISDVLLKHTASHFLPVLKIIGEALDGDTGTFVVLNDDGAIREIEMNIMTRFKYRTVFVGSVDELFGAVADYGVRFILINLGTKAIDLNGLVRKFYASQAAHNIPVLAYKDMREGLFVHELVGGLNRLTRYILSLDELYSLLVDMLFRREMIPMVATLKKLTDFDASSCYDAESLSQAFFSCEKNIFDQANLFDEDILSSLIRVVQGMNKTILKTETLKWLKIEINRKDISIAGREG